MKGLWQNRTLMGFLLGAGLVILLGGCQTAEPQVAPAFGELRPRTILVLPPVNESMNVHASASLLAQVQFPVGEAGYYVLPVGLVMETFRENGFTEAEAIREISRKRLREIFHADAVLLLTIVESGTEYKVVASDTRVTAEAELLDLATGRLLWRGGATASSTESSSAGGGIVGMLVQAVVEQVFHTASDQSHQIAGITAWRLLHRDSPAGLPDGPLLEALEAERE